MSGKTKKNNTSLHVLYKPSSSSTEIVSLSLDDSNNPSSQRQHLLRELAHLGVDFLDAPSNIPTTFIEAMADFADYVLGHDNFESITLPILQKYQYADDDGSCEPPVGELQGGGGDEDENDNSSSSIFRVVLPSPPIQELLQKFHKYYPKYVTIFTEQSLLDFMLDMCNDGRRNVHSDLIIERLGNPMLIFSRGNFTSPPFGQQIQHIDHCQPNVQVGVYMSRDCPATLVFRPSDDIESVADLIEYWNESGDDDEDTLLPPLISETLLKMQDQPLQEYSKYFASWKTTLNQQLERFGRLFADIEKIYQIKNCPPGTTFLGSDNPIHAGPPLFQQPRMFAYAIGIPSESGSGGDDDESMENDQNCCTNTYNVHSSTGNDDQNDGEIQYNPVLLHVDLCCILFTVWGHMERDENDTNAQQIHEAKRYMVKKLPGLIREFPYEDFQRLLSDERHAIRQWLFDLHQAVVVQDDDTTIQGLLETAVASSTILVCPKMDNIPQNGMSKQQQRRKERKQRQKVRKGKQQAS